MVPKQHALTAGKRLEFVQHSLVARLSFRPRATRDRTTADMPLVKLNAFLQRNTIVRGIFQYGRVRQRQFHGHDQVELSNGLRGLGQILGAEGVAAGVRLVGPAIGGSPAL